MLHHKIGANFLHHFFYCFFLTIGDKKHCKKGICNFYTSIIQSRCPNILSFPFSFLHHRWDKEDCGMECHKEKWTKNKNCKQSRLVLTQRLGMRQVCQCNDDSRVQCREGGGHRESVGDGAGGGVEPGEPAWCGSRDQAPGPGSATQWTKSTFYWLAPARTSPATTSSPGLNILPYWGHNHLALVPTEWLLLVPTPRPHTLIWWSVTSKGCWPSYSLLSNPRVSCAPGLLQLCSRTSGLFTDNIETVT